MRQFSNRVHEHLAFIQRGDVPNTRLAIFIHGFRGNYLETWGRVPDMLMSHADGHPVLAGWDFLFVGYDTRDVETYLDIAKHLTTHWDKAQRGIPPFRHPYEQCAFFGHSLGTLGIRQLLCAQSEHSPGFLNQVKSVTLFGTPLNGSFLANFAFGYRIKEALKPGSPQLRMLRTWMLGVLKTSPWLPVTVVLGQDDKVVGFKYADLVDWPGDSRPHEYPLDHGALVKPEKFPDAEVFDYLIAGMK